MFQRVRKRLLAAVPLALITSVVLASPASAQGDEPPPEVLTQWVLNNLWIFIAGVLVFFMQAGFGLVEAGLTRAKNVANIMAKNLADVSIGLLVFFAVGYGLAYGSDGGSLFGTDGWFLLGDSVGGNSFAGSEGGLQLSTNFFFQSAFAATAATIVSGAMAERTKFVAYLMFTVVMVALIYPLVVHSFWSGEGILADLNIGGARFTDFAGSTIVHSVGGWAALMGAIFLGPRLGKYGKDGKPRAIPGHSIPFAVIGVFILWLGWFGFNPGSQLAADSMVVPIAVNTTLAAAAGAIAAGAVIWLKVGRPDVAMIGNGALAGLVGITAGCAAVNTAGAVAIGSVAGIIVVFSVLFFDRVHVDDPVGAISVHGICGVWGTLAVGLFARYDDAFLGRVDAGLFYGGGFEQLAVQAIGVAIVAVFVLSAASLTFAAIKATVGLRVSPEEELAGLDVMEHGAPGYASDPGATSLPA